MPDDLYQRHFVAWSTMQADALRRLRPGARANDVDWENLIEEVETLGRSETRAVDAYLLRALIHALKVAAWPDSPAARKWRNEVDLFLTSARRGFAPSTRQVIDLTSVHRAALRNVRRLSMPRPPRPLAEMLELTLDELLDEDLDLDALIVRLAAPEP